MIILKLNFSATKNLLYPCEVIKLYSWLVKVDYQPSTFNEWLLFRVKLITLNETQKGNKLTFGKKKLTNSSTIAIECAKCLTLLSTINHFCLNLFRSLRIIYQ